MEAPSSECELGPCVRLLAGAWTLQVIYYLRVEPLRFGQLRRVLKGISSKVLTTRLRELEERSVVSRTVIPSNPPSVEYALTDLGKELLPILDAFSAVSHRLKARYEGGA